MTSKNDQVELVAEVKSAIKIPLAVKISPFVTSIPNFVKRLVDAGADGLVLFNRFYQPDFDLDELEIVHSLDLSTSVRSATAFALDLHPAWESQCRFCI